MAKYESKVKEVNALQANVYNRLSDLSQLQAIKDNMPAEVKEQIKAKMNEETGGKLALSNFNFTTDTASFKASGMDVCIRIIDREPTKCVKFTADNSPIAFTLWIQMLPAGPYTTKIRVTLDVDIPFYLRPMIGSKLDGAADQIAEMLTRIPY